MARKMYREAVDFYKAAIAEQPKSPRLYNKLGISYHHQLMFGQARRSYERASALDSKYAQAVNNLGTIYYVERNYKKAQKHYEKALKIAPSASVYSNLGTAFFARRKYKQAAEAYLTALRLDPEVFNHKGSTGTLLQERSVEDRARYHFFLAKAYAQAGILDKCVISLRRAIEEGYDRRKALDDKVFVPFLELPEFQVLVNPEGVPNSTG
jgi:tetratricopeptide (TPR) repeat protein